MRDSRAIAMSNQIIRGVVGSTAHGVNIQGQDDRDEMAVFIEPPAEVCGLESLDHWIERTQPEGVRSGPGDLDLTMYSLRKFCRLATKGNPSVQILLWLPAHEHITPLGRELISLREAFISHHCGMAYLGYLRAQLSSLLGERSKKVQRPELVERYGYDTKFAMHALRLAFEGVEMMAERRLTLPVPAERREVLYAMRTGVYPFEEAVGMIRSEAEKLRALVDRRQDWEPDLDTVTQFLVYAHEAHWRIDISAVAAAQ